MLIGILLGIFLILHGLVHLLYAGQSQRLFELRPGLLWPEGSWLFSRQLDDDAMRLMAVISLALAAFGCVAGGLGLFFHQDWWRTIIVGAAILSTTIFAVFWDGKRQSLADNGGVGVLINLAILVSILILK
jgi:hypothetical protein